MRLSMIVNPFTDDNLALAAQVGVEEIVTPYPGLELDPLLAMCRRVESFGMRLTHVERMVPTLKFIHDLPGRDEQVANFKRLIRNMGEAGLEVLCYSWMPDDDWQRTRCDVPERGGALVTEFNLAELSRGNITDARHDPACGEPTPADRLWENLDRFLDEVVPVAEQAGVRLALHPDDPPLRTLRGQDRIIFNHDAMERAVQLVPSPANGLCYCQGSMAAAGEDVVAGIRRLAPYIVYGHFRDVVGTVPHFRESFHDNGDTDMVAAMQAWRDIGYTGTLRPDHAPSMRGELNETPGYEMLGRLYAAGYMRGLMQATRRQAGVATRDGGIVDEAGSSGAQQTSDGERCGDSGSSR